VNEWLVIPLSVIAFVIVAIVILAVIFGGWLGVRWVTDRVSRSLPQGRLRRG
jgi:uncharacterized membrane protein (DUF485 family)